MTIAGVVVLIVIGWVAVSVLVGGYPVPIDSYTQVSDQALSVQVTGGNGVWCRLADVQENQQHVRVRAKCLRWNPLPSTALGQPVDLALRLNQPLGSRVVMDGDGNLVRRTGHLGQASGSATADGSAR